VHVRLSRMDVCRAGTQLNGLPGVVEPLFMYSYKILKLKQRRDCEAPSLYLAGRR
jgi:hypothetical protein